MTQHHCVLFHGYDLIESWRYGSTFYFCCSYASLVLSWIHIVLVNNHALHQSITSNGISNLGIKHMYYHIFSCIFKRFLPFKILHSIFFVNYFSHECLLWPHTLGGIFYHHFVTLISVAIECCICHICHNCNYLTQVFHLLHWKVSHFQVSYFEVMCHTLKCHT